MSEMKTPIKTLNGHALEDTEARAKVNQLSEEIAKIPEPYELPTASADVKGGVKVGEGLQMTGDVLGVKPGSTYNHIETFTLNETGNVIRTKEPDGRNYNFIGCIVLIHVGEVVNDLSVSLYMKNSKTNKNIVRLPLGKAGTNYYGFVKADKINNVWSHCGRMLTDDEMLSANLFTSYYTLSLNEGSESVIDKIQIFNLPIGTTITIMGVRADA